MRLLVLILLLLLVLILFLLAPVSEASWRGGRGHGHGWHGGWGWRGPSTPVCQRGRVEDVKDPAWRVFWEDGAAHGLPGWKCSTRPGDGKDWYDRQLEAVRGRTP